MLVPHRVNLSSKQQVHACLSAPVNASLRRVGRHAVRCRCVGRRFRCLQREAQGLWGGTREGMAVSWQWWRGRGEGEAEGPVKAEMALRHL